MRLDKKSSKSIHWTAPAQSSTIEAIRPKQWVPTQRRQSIVRVEEIKRVSPLLRPAAADPPPIHSTQAKLRFHSADFVHGLPRPEMSLVFDEYGRPFVILREQQQQARIKGLEAQKANILAARSVSNALRSSLGPKGQQLLPSPILYPS